MSMSKVDMRVRQGEIVVNSGLCVVDQEDCVVWIFDLKSKYPEAYYVYGSPDDDKDGDADQLMSLHLHAGERTLYADKGNGGDTCLTGVVVADDERWEIIADWGRYTVTVCFYRHPNPADDLTWIDYKENK